MNKYEKIDIISCQDILDLYDKIINSLSKIDNEHDYIAVYGKCDLIGSLFEKFICNNYSFDYVDFDRIDEMSKDTVYLMTIDTNGIVDIEKAYSESEHMKIVVQDAVSAFISMDDCKQDIIDYCINENENVILFDFDVEDTEKEDININDISKDEMINKTIDEAYGIFDRWVNKTLLNLILRL